MLSLFFGTIEFWCPNCRNSTFYFVAIILICFVVSLQAFYIVTIYLLWRWGIWPMVNEYEYSKSQEIKRSYVIYQLQYPILHGKLITIGQWLCLYSTFVATDIKNLREGYMVPRNFHYFLVPLNSLFCLYSISMIKGVSK